MPQTKPARVHAARLRPSRDCRTNATERRPEGDSPAEALYSQGLALWAAGLREPAIAKFDAALRRRPEFPEALCMAGYVLGEMGKPQAAVQFYLRALELNDRLPTAWANLGKERFKARQFEEALTCFDKALALTPMDADVWNCRAGALRELGQMALSERAAREALRLRPQFAEAALNLANALLKQDRMERALVAYRRAQALAPRFAAAHCGEALALKALGRFREAHAAFSIAEDLGSIEAKAGKGCLQLLQGDFAQGWEGYEHRWFAGRSLADALGARFPTWQGPGTPGAHVLVLNDHGLGDTIQFCRYLPLMAAAGVAPSLASPPKMRRLLSTCADIAMVDEANPGSSFDAQIALSSLPRAFATRLATIPARTPYLFAEPRLKEHWARRIGPHGFKIGVVWQGNANPEADAARSFPLASLSALAAIDGIRLISLQKGEVVRQIEALHGIVPVETLGEEFDAGPDAFVDAAAAMMQLDLVISCDTSIAHLAGALGRPIWVALKKDAEWRWLLNRADSPWYPSMRLFRQPRRGDWGGLFAAMAGALRAQQSGTP